MPINPIIVTEQPEKIQWFIETTQLPHYAKIPPYAQHIFYFQDAVMSLITPSYTLPLQDTLPQDVWRHPLYTLIKRYDKAGSTLIDATGGLGQDSLIALYATPNPLITYERCPILALALIWLAYKHKEQWTIRATDALHCTEPSNIWLIDPMFPPHPKTAHSQKRLQIIQSFVTPDQDYIPLVHHALSQSQHVFLKQPQPSKKNSYGLWTKVDASWLSS